MLNIIPYPNHVKQLGGTAAFNGDVKINTALQTDEYRINCVNGVAEVEAGGDEGAFYALETIKQLKDENGILPAVEICDKPFYKYRGFMLDCARHFWSVEKIKQFLDVMAALKLNYFHWHLTEDQGWRAEIKKYPLLTGKGAVRKGTPLKPSAHKADDGVEYGNGLFYTQEEMREVVAYAKARKIEVIPEIDMPGHLVAAIACYPNLSCTSEQVEVSAEWGVLDNIGCCGKDDVYNFIKDVIDELVEIFSCEYFHIGGDEVPKGRWEKCPACQAKMRELNLKNENALQGHFNNEICKYLKTKNKKMIGWNEILEASDTLDKDIITQFWTSNKTHLKSVRTRLNDGGKVLLSVWGFVYMDHPYLVRNLKKTYSLSAKNVGLEASPNIIGVEAPQWTEYVRDEKKLDFNTYPRLITMAEVGWTNDENKNYKCFETRLENMRGYFKSLGASIPAKKYYRGETLKFARFARGWKLWRSNPNFELELK
jgi:hexosaminidase